MCITAPGCLHQLVHNMARSGLVRIAHTEVDNVFSGRPSLLLEVTDNIEHVWRQALNTPKLIVHDNLTLLGAQAPAPRFKKGRKQY